MITSRSWTEEEKTYLINNYFKQGVKTCANYLDRTNISVERKVRALGLYHKSKNKTTESYIDELVDLEISICPIEDYKGSHVSILHEHLDCGHIWPARPTNILFGKGCPKCALTGFDNSKSAILYFIQFEYKEIRYYKIGITNRTPEERLFKDWKRFKMSKVWQKHYDKGIDAYRMEQNLIKENSCYSINLNCLHSGNTETFTTIIEEP